MRIFRSIIYSDITLSVLLIITILARSLFIEKKPLGLVTLPIICLLFANIIFCIISVKGIQRGHGKLISRIWISILSLFIFYFIVDLASGYFLLPQLDNTEEQKLPDKVLHHKLAPDVTIRMIVPDYNVTMKTNSLGLRAKNISEKKDNSVYRIVMLGDSFTMGEGVNYEDTFSNLIETYLNKSSKRKYDVIDCGVESYSPVLEYLQLKEDIGILKPDMVIMNFDMSDVLNEYLYRKEGTFGKDSEPMAVNGFQDFNKARRGAVKRIENWVYRNLFITSALSGLLRKHMEKPLDIKNVDLEAAVVRSNRMLLLHTLKEPEFEEFGAIMSEIEDSILRTKKLCDEHGSKFILSAYPWGHQVNDREWIPGKYDYISKSSEISDRTVKELERFCIQNNIPFFNAFPYFRNYKGEELLYYHHDMHWTPAGNKLMARFIYEALSIYFRHNG